MKSPQYINFDPVYLTLCAFDLNTVTSISSATPCYLPPSLAKPQFPGRGHNNNFFPLSKTLGALMQENASFFSNF